ncbi:hypothetical protein MG293_020282 [Ovis ammon polii]|uniref:Secreted protein n=1 Tax=Ovis ammon polii TaxID=230172 RepID=A0AAD4TNM7_OVIAM|nr:hypothetical protein MG293_020282 [Ovis ammon polii]
MWSLLGDFLICSALMGCLSSPPQQRQPQQLRKRRAVFCLGSCREGRIKTNTFILGCQSILASEKQGRKLELHQLVFLSLRVFPPNNNLFLHFKRVMWNLISQTSDRPHRLEDEMLTMYHQRSPSIVSAFSSEVSHLTLFLLHFRHLLRRRSTLILSKGDFLSTD